MGLACIKLTENAEVETPRFRNGVVPRSLYSTQFKDCCFKAGHNSYVDGNQIGGEASYQTLINCLGHGCRTIELDIAGMRDDKIVVGHCAKKICGTDLILLRECLRILNKYAWKNSNYPLILCFDIKSTDVNLSSDVRSLVKKIFGKRFYENEITPKTLISDLVGKTVIYPKGHEGFISYPASKIKDVTTDITAKTVIRSYPGNVVSSANYNITEAFSKGIQTVAINWGEMDACVKTYNRLMDNPIESRRSMILKTRK